MKSIEIIKYWNRKNGTFYKFSKGDEPTTLVKSIDDLITIYGEEKVTKYFANSNESNIYVAIDKSGEIKNMTDDAPKDLFDTPKEEKSATPNFDGNDLMKMLAGQIVNIVGVNLANQIAGEVEKKVDSYVEGKTLTKIIEYKNERKKVNGLTHKMFENVLKFVAMDEPVMLVGPAGTGKNVLAKQIADSLGLNFYFTSAVTQEYKLTGYGDANGKFVPTQFYEAFVNGGLFMFDEVDASTPEAMVVVNSAIANRYFDFPVVGRVQANENFRILACANTYGTGASLEYVGRNQLDGATLNRFAVVEIDYDKRVEDAVCPNKDIADFCREFRKCCNKNGVQHIVSYREMGRLYKMICVAEMEKEFALKSCLLKGLEKDSVNMILDSMKELTYKQVLADTAKKYC